MTIHILRNPVLNSKPIDSFIVILKDSQSAIRVSREVFDILVTEEEIIINNDVFHRLILTN